MKKHSNYDSTTERFKSTIEKNKVHVPSDKNLNTEEKRIL